MKFTAAAVATAQLLAVAYAQGQDTNTPFNPGPPTSGRPPTQTLPPIVGPPTSRPNQPPTTTRPGTWPPNPTWPDNPTWPTTPGGWNPPPTSSPGWGPPTSGGGPWPSAPPSNYPPGWVSNTFALRVNAPDWQEMNGRYLEVHGDPDAAVNWISVAPVDAGQYPNIFDWVNYFQGRSYGNIHYRVPGGAGELYGGFLQAAIDQRQSPRAVFMTNPGNRRNFHWLDDSWMGNDGKMRRDPNDLPRDPRSDPKKVGDNWLLCRIFVRRWNQPGSTEEWALHWTDNDQYDSKDCWDIGLTFEYRRPWGETAEKKANAVKNLSPPHNDEK